ncbi:hypothetical protein NUM3379_35000 [Kineococcus sp. NUM-3379]
MTQQPDDADAASPAGAQVEADDAASRAPGETADAVSRRRRNTGAQNRSLRRGQRRHRLAPTFDDEEFAVLAEAAQRAGLTPTGYIAESALAAARATAPPTVGPQRQLLLELMETRTQLVRFATNVNQAVAALNATGTAPAWLEQAVAITRRAVVRVDEATAAVQRGGRS